MTAIIGMRDAVGTYDVEAKDVVKQAEMHRTEPHLHHSPSSFNPQVKSDIVLKSGEETVKIMAQRLRMLVVTNTRT